MSPTPTYLLARPSGYAFRIKVPKDLTDILNRREVKYALRHNGKAAALKEARRLAVAAEDVFESIRQDPLSWTERHQKHLKGLITSPSRLQYHSLNKKQGNSPIKLGELVERYIDENTFTGAWTTKTHHENAAIYQLAIRILGDIPAYQLSHDHLRDYKNTLCQLPPNLNKDSRYRDLSIEELVATQTKRMSINTINKNLNRMSSLLKWAVRHGYIERNFAEGLQLKTAKRPDQERPPFTQEQLQTIFSSEVYTGRGNLHPYYFWLPLLGLFTGARLDELCQLHLEDVRQEDDTWVIDINAKTSDKKLKTLSSERLVPIHPMLLQAGLLKYVDSLKQKKQIRLFPELRRGRDGYGQAASKWFGRLRAKLGLQSAEGKSPDFHSFRHNLSNNLRAQSVSIDEVGDILGHANPTTTARYTKRLSPSHALMILNKLDYGLELDNIKYRDHED